MVACWETGGIGLDTDSSELPGDFGAVPGSCQASDLIAWLVPWWSHNQMLLSGVGAWLEETGPQVLLRKGRACRGLVAMESPVSGEERGS